MLTQIRNIGVAAIFATLLMAGQAFGQLGQTVSGTIVDPVGNPYASGTYSFVFVAGPGGTTIGSNQSVATVTGALNGSGAFSGVLLGNTDSLGGGARWRATICASNGQCFTASFNVTSTTSSLSTILSAFAPLLTSPTLGNLTPATATGGQTIGSAALPWTGVFFGNAATNNAEITGTFGQATAFTFADPGTAAVTMTYPTVEFCGATSGATQACAKTVKNLGILVFGNVTLNSAATQAITTLPFTSASTYSCWGSDFTTAAGIVSFSVYTSGASATVKESGGTTADVIYYGCAGY